MIALQCDICGGKSIGRPGGLFSGKRRKEIENRLAEIETELKGLI